jgi:hypothetical protein
MKNELRAGENATWKRNAIVKLVVLQGLNRFARRKTLADAKRKKRAVLLVAPAMRSAFDRRSKPVLMNRIALRKKNVELVDESNEKAHGIATCHVNPKEKIDLEATVGDRRM